MELSLDDIRRLYGNTLYILPEEVPEEEVLTEVELKEEEVEVESLNKFSPEEFMQGGKVIWKMKPQSSFVLVLEEEEFKNRSCTSYLKVQIDRVELNTALVGFGVLGGETDYWDFSEMQVVFGVVFTSKADQVEEIQLPGERQLIIFPKIRDIEGDKQFTAQLHSVLQKIKNSV